MIIWYRISKTETETGRGRGRLGEVRGMGRGGGFYIFPTDLCKAWIFMAEKEVDGGFQKGGGVALGCWSRHPCIGVLVSKLMNCCCVCVGALVCERRGVYIHRCRNGLIPTRLKVEKKTRQNHITRLTNLLFFQIVTWVATKMTQHVRCRDPATVILLGWLFRHVLIIVGS